MKIVGRSRLEAFCDRHADARKWIEHWLSEVEAGRWVTPQDIRARYASASFLAHNVVIFNVRGNEYRLEARVAYQSSVIVVTWIGTHAEYDQRNRKR
jgi:mRNA interferase HigB